MKKKARHNRRRLPGLTRQLVIDFMQTSLPHSSFVAFSANRSAHAKLVWNNPNGIAGANLSDHAYHVLLKSDDPGTVTNDTKDFLAERYGGAGIASNGGGARCGLTGSVQIKGVGRNALAGNRSSYWHSYGGETVAGGVRDAIWGEICHATLPFGAVRVHGLIDTGTTVPRFAVETGAPATARRGLTVRQPALRPAHFMRALGFSRVDEKHASLVGDAERTRAAIYAIVPAFQSIYGPARQSKPTASYINDCVTAMFTRFAYQLAAARAKRIVHGTISSSNLCLDGRWIDFGTCSSVSDYGKIIVAKTGSDASQTAPILLVAVELAANLRRYLPPPLASNLAVASEVYQNFRAIYDQRLDLELLKLTGMPEARLLQLPHRLRSVLSAKLHIIISAGNGEQFKLFNQCGRGSHMPGKMGRYQLNNILCALAMSTEPHDCEWKLQGQIAEIDLRTSIICAYFELRRAYLALFDSERQNAALEALRLNTTRLNSPLPGLYRHVLDQHIDAIVDSHDSVDSLISSISRHAIDMLADADADGFGPAATGSEGLCIAESAGSLKQGLTIPYQLSMNLLQARIEAHVSQFSKAPSCAIAF